jgi:hypothetical protein
VKSLLKASADATYVEAVRLLINVPLAARNADFGDALRQLDLQVQDRPSLIGIIAAVTNRLDSISRESPTRTDLSDLVSRALSAAFSNSVGEDLPGLFSASAEDVRLSFGKHSRNDGMSAICRSFFAALVGTSLSYWLDRTLDNHIGTSKTFSRVSERVDFDHALQAYVGETTRIVKEFSAGWVGKTARWSGRISSAEARTFGHVCLKKIVDELRAKRGDDD